MCIRRELGNFFRFYINSIWYRAAGTCLWGCEDVICKGVSVNVDFFVIQEIWISLSKVSADYGNTGCGVFKRGVQNEKDFCLRINILKGNYWILSFGLMASCQKVPKFDFQSQFSMSKIIRIFLNFFFIEEYYFRSTFFDKINF